jgi:hypothetical protein
MKYELLKRLYIDLDEGINEWNKWNDVVVEKLLNVKIVHPSFTFIEDDDILNFMPVRKRN